VLTLFQSMEPKIIKEEAIERDSGTLIDDPAINNNNNNNKESAFRIHIRKFALSLSYVLLLPLQYCYYYCNYTVFT